MAEEVSLTPAERDHYEHEASIYAIIRTLEQLERAWINDKLENDDEYNQLCKKLISQYKTVVESLEGQYPGLLPFSEKYSLTSSCKMALKRLQVGLSAAEVSGTGGSDKGQGLRIVEATQSFITARDALELNYTEVDQLQPLIQEIVTCLGKVSGIPASYNGRQVMVGWLSQFSHMRASDSLDAGQIRQLNYDLDRAYHDFKQAME